MTQVTKTGPLKEAHCTMNKQIEVKNTETLTRYHKKRQGRDLREGKGLPTRAGGSDNQKERPRWAWWVTPGPLPGPLLTKAPHSCLHLGIQINRWGTATPKKVEPVRSLPGKVVTALVLGLGRWQWWQSGARGGDQRLGLLFSPKDVCPAPTPQLWSKGPLFRSPCHPAIT